MPDDIYWQDSLAWCEQQAALLQRLANGERVNADIDWEHVVEEVRDVGMSELRAVSSLLMHGLEHLMKLHAWPDAAPADHWRVETFNFLFDAQSACSPSMRNRVNLALAYRRATAVVSQLRIDGRPAAGLSSRCPFELDELLPLGDVPPDIDALVARLGKAAAGG